MYDYRRSARFHRAGYVTDSPQNTHEDDVDEYGLLIDSITRTEMLYGEDISIVSSPEEMNDDAQGAYLTGMMESGAIQPSMFFEPTNQVYLIIPSIQQAVCSLGIEDREFILNTTLCSAVVFKQMRQLLDDNGDGYEYSMTTFFDALGSKKILNKKTISGDRIKDIYADQIKPLERPVKKYKKVLLSELYFSSISGNLIGPKGFREKMYDKFINFISSLLNLRLSDGEVEKIIRAAWEHRRSQ